MLFRSVTIPTEGWEAEEGIYRFRLDLPVEGAGTAMVPQLTVLPEGERTAASCGLCPAAEAVKDAVRLWAVKPPEKPVPASLALLRDSSGLVFSPDSGGAIPAIATETEPGAVKPGPGLLISADGTLSVASASDEDIQRILDGDGPINQ